MMTIGGDSHKRTHTFVVVDDVGRKVAEKTVPATRVCSGAQPGSYQVTPTGPDARPAGPHIAEQATAHRAPKKRANPAGPRSG